MTNRTFAHRFRHWLASAAFVLSATLSVAHSEVRYYHTDALGSVAAISDEAGNVVERREYDPFGQQLTPTLADGPGFAGHVADKATGLVQMQERYYDPETGTFVSVDPVTAFGGDLRHFGRYAYAYNSPTTYVDLDGRQGMHFFTNGLEPLLHARMAYNAYKNGRMSAPQAARALRDYGAAGKNYLQELRQVIRQDAKGLERERRNGVARAWAAERALVAQSGEGSQRWTESQVAELLATGRVSGYDGHHINSVIDNPELAGVADNVRFYTREHHLDQHGGNWKNSTSGEMVNRTPGMKGKFERLMRTGSHIFRRAK